VGKEEVAEAARTSDDDRSDAETTLGSADTDLGSDAGASEDDWASGSEDELPDLVPAWQVISERSDEEELPRPWDYLADMHGRPVYHFDEEVVPLHTGVGRIALHQTFITQPNDVGPNTSFQRAWRDALTEYLTTCADGPPLMPFVIRRGR